MSAPSVSTSAAESKRTLAMRTEEHRDVHAEMRLRTVSELCHMPPETTVKYHRLRGHVDAYQCCGKSLTGSELMRVGVCQHARPESISKRAPSTTRTSLLFRINDLRAARQRLSHTPAQCLPRSPFDSAAYGRASAGLGSKRVRPLNLVRSLTSSQRCRWSVPHEQPQACKKRPALRY
jgi:hypothetical protein